MHAASGIVCPADCQSQIDTGNRSSRARTQQKPAPVRLSIIKRVFFRCTQAPSHTLVARTDDRVARMCCQLCWLHLNACGASWLRSFSSGQDLTRASIPNNHIYLRAMPTSCSSSAQYGLFPMLILIMNAICHTYLVSPFCLTVMQF